MRNFPCCYFQNKSQVYSNCNAVLNSIEPGLMTCTIKIGSSNCHFLHFHLLKPNVLLVLYNKCGIVFLPSSSIFLPPICLNGWMRMCCLFLKMQQDGVTNLSVMSSKAPNSRGAHHSFLMSRTLSCSAATTTVVMPSIRLIYQCA